MRPSPRPPRAHQLGVRAALTRAAAAFDPRKAAAGLASKGTLDMGRGGAEGEGGEALSTVVLRAEQDIELDAFNDWVCAPGRARRRAAGGGAGQ